MPIVYRCKKCGYVLYVFWRVGSSYGVPTPSEIISRYGGYCPKCGKRLQKPSWQNIVIAAEVPSWLKELKELEKKRGRRSVVVTVKLPEWTVEALEELGRKKGRSRGELIREAITRYLSCLGAKDVYKLT